VHEARGVELEQRAIELRGTLDIERRHLPDRDLQHEHGRREPYRDHRAVVTEAYDVRARAHLRERTADALQLLL
jgi:hypothetical protein